MDHIIGACVFLDQWGAGLLLRRLADVYGLLNWDLHQTLQCMSLLVQGKSSFVGYT